MTDFIADLEAELVSAARRRATRRRLPRPRLAPVIAVAAVALAAIFVVRAFDRPQTADERPAQPAGEGIAVILPPALDAAATKRECEQAEGWEAYAPADPTMSVFARPRADEDALPTGGDWLNASFVLLEASRRAGSGELWVVPVAGPNCRGGRDTLVGGVCLVAGADDPVARCFSDAEIDAGKAIALIRPGTVAGIAPDGITDVSVDGVDASVVENVFEARVPVEAGDQVHVRLTGTSRVCGPSPAAYEAVPALRQPPTGNATRELELAMAGNGNRGAWRASAREITTPEGLKVWVVADEPCDRPNQYDEQVCLLPEGGVLACETPATLVRRGLTVKFPRGDRQVIAGIVPEGTKRVEVQVNDLIYLPHRVGRVYGTSVRVLRGHHVEVRLR